MKDLKLFVGSFVALAVAFIVVLVFGVHGLFVLFALFFITIAVMALINKKERIWGFAWLLFTLGIIAIYIWDAWYRL